MEQRVTFGEIAYRFPDGVPIGVRDADGEIVMNPNPERPMAEGDEVLIVADDDSTIDYQADALRYRVTCRCPRCATNNAWNANS